MTRARDLSEIVNSTGLSVDTDTLVVDSANNRVGIGTSDPTTKLVVASSIARTDTVTPDTATVKIANNLNDGLAFGHYLSSPFGSWIQSGYLLDGYVPEWNQGYPISLNPQGGNVGIGVVSPTAKLHLGGAAPLDSIIRQDSTASGTNWEIGEREAGKWQIWEDDTDSVVTTFTSTGNVGIGTDSPVSFGANTAGLTVNGSSGSHVTWQNNGTNVAFAYNVGNNFLIGSEQVGSTLTFLSSGATRMTIDAGGSVLIGKTTPADLHDTWNHIIIGDKGAIISENGAGGIDGITLADNAYIDSDTGTYAYQTAAAASLIRQSGGVTTFSNAASGSAGAALTPVVRVAIEADGKVDVGGVANQTTAVLNARFNGAAFEFGHGNNGAGYYGTAGSYGNNGQPYIGFSCDAEESVNTFTTRGAKGNLITGDLSGNLTFAQITTATGTGLSPENRMTLDAIGNLLVGGTDTSPGAGSTATGVAIRGGSDNRSFFSVSSNYVAAFNRNSDGNIIEFNKDGAGVGSIGVYNGVPYIGYSAGTGGGIMFNGKSIEPTAVGSSRTDGENDIGGNLYRWKDLYISDGVVLDENPTIVGTTVAARTIGSKTLDDYEEGTWTTVFGTLANLTGTPVLSEARYTKIGNLVSLSGKITGTTVTSAGTETTIILDLPFLMDTITAVAVGSSYWAGSIRQSGVVVPNTGANSDEIYLSLPDFGWTGNGNLDISFTFTYQAL